MNAIDFYRLTLQLSNETGAAEMRSSISRAYYGAFNLAAEVVRSIGIALPKGPECHDKVAKILCNCGDADVEAAGGKLDSLRAQGNAADYQLLDARTEKKPTVILHLRVADDIIQCLEQCLTGREKATVQPGMRKYAADVLRLPVQ